MQPDDHGDTREVGGGQHGHPSVNIASVLFKAGRFLISLRCVRAALLSAPTR